MKLQDLHPLQPGMHDLYGRMVTETFYNENNEPCYRAEGSDVVWKAQYLVPPARQKPALGLVPRHIWEYKRGSAIMRAIIRYEDAGKVPPGEWWDELRSLLEKKP